MARTRKRKDVLSRIQELQEQLVSKLEIAIDSCDYEGVKIDALVRAYAQLLDANAKLVNSDDNGIKIKVEYLDTNV